MYTFDTDIVSDLHKDAYGFRPREYFWAEWMAANDEGKQQIWDQLLVALKESIEQEKAEQAEAREAFQERIKFMQATIVGATYEDCIRYLHDVYKTDGDLQFLEYHLGVGYGYLTGKNLG